MWPKKYDQASWNGIAFNILKTDDEEGKRLDAKALPYSDDHFIEVMGATIPTYTIEAVFVGADSLSDASSFRSELRQNPVGVLEHPYLGELKLVYKTSSQSFTTKKGLVSLALSFIRQGKPIDLPKTTAKSLNRFTDPVIASGTDQFEKQIQASNVAEVEIVKSEYQVLLDDIGYLATQSKTQDNVLLGQISGAKTALSSLANNPRGFADQVSGMMDGFVTNVQSNSAADPVARLQANSLEKTTKAKLVANEASATTNLLKLQTTTAQLKLNRELAAVTNSESSSDMALNPDSQNLDHSYDSINQVKTALDQRITENTSAADYETLPLVDNLSSLKSEVVTQQTKVGKYQAELITADTYSPKPSMLLAYENECDLTEFEWLNNSPHPLFVSGSYQVKK